MPEWPHSPVHRLRDGGTFMVTSGTYQKQAFFRGKRRLNLLCQTLLKLSAELGWQLQAWAVFPNHYHFLAVSPPQAESLRKLIARVHAFTAQQINELDGAPGRRVWFEYWDSRITFQRAYLARLAYVHANAVHHGLVREATLYPWCSAGWFQQKADSAFQRTIASFRTNRVQVRDAFNVLLEDVRSE